MPLSETLVDMDKRLADMPVMAQRTDLIDAKIFNLWRRYRKLPDALSRFELPGLKTMRFIFTDSYWVVADCANYDAPIVAWIEFCVADRSSLHEPIDCKINYYHFAASAIRAKSLGLIGQIMEENLKRA